MKKIGLIPIDNRPVCYTLPKMTAEINPETELVLPSRKMLGSLTENANIDALFEWIEDLRGIDYLIISADTLLYGGLVSSRRSQESKEEIERRILKLRNILLKKENCKTLVFSSIMRISNNNENQEEKEYWSEWGKKIFAYSYNMSRFEVEGNDFCKKEANKMAGEIPQDILIDWFSTRERNFSVNKMLVKLYDDKLIDTLVFSKDDCAQFGFNVKEAKYFEFEAQKRKGVLVKTGADEIPLTLLARCVTDGQKVKIAPIYTQKEATSLISNYEDISVAESVKSQILTAGAQISDTENADLILYVNNFREKQGELVMNVETEGFDGEIEKFSKPFFVVDILNANGADNGFVEKLLKEGRSDNFYGYSAWNTTGNSLGSGICAALCAFLAKTPDKKAFDKLQTVRLLDDWAYQANVRKKIKKKNITDKNAVKQEFRAYEECVEKFLGEGYEIEYSFPWERFFEIEVAIK